MVIVSVEIVGSALHLQRQSREGGTVPSTHGSTCQQRWWYQHKLIERIDDGIAQFSLMVLVAVVVVVAATVVVAVAGSASSGHYRDRAAGHEQWPTRAAGKSIDIVVIHLGEKEGRDCHFEIGFGSLSEQ